MDKERAIDKVRKLLALAGSDNPNEAQAALLRARALMAEYKLHQKDLDDAQSSTLEYVQFGRLTYSNLRNTWMPALAVVIGDAHCCGTTRCGIPGSKVGNIVFTGLGDDPHIACVIFDYAVQHIERWGKDARKENEEFASAIHADNRRQLVNALTRRDIANYAKGFAIGLERQYKEQTIKHIKEMSLMVVKPVQVQNFIAGLKEDRTKYRPECADESVQQEGYAAGYRFDPTPQIANKGGVQYVSE